MSRYKQHFRTRRNVSGTQRTIAGCNRTAARLKRHLYTTAQCLPLLQRLPQRIRTQREDEGARRCSGAVLHNHAQLRLGPSQLKARRSTCSLLLPGIPPFSEK